MEITPRTIEILEDILNRQSPMSSTWDAEERAAVSAAVSCTKKWLARQRKRETQPAKVGRKWEELEDSQLMEAFDKGTDVYRLAENHARTEGAILARLLKLGRIDSSTVLGKARVIPSARGSAPES